MQAVVLAVVAVGITVAVYGGVALIVKADDAGVRLAASDAAPVRALGRGLVKAMPVFLKVLSVVGTAAMVWVGGGIVVHGLEVYGWDTLGHAIHDIAGAAGRAVPAFGAAVTWLVSAAGSGVVGLVLGAVLIPVVGKVLAPLWRGAKALVGRGG
jgi:predicted DNA repair protein MutK